MRTLIMAATTLVLLASTDAFAAREVHGHGTREEVRAFCNRAGGELLGISEFGSYGCELSDGTLILCNGGSCTIYVPSKNAAQRRKIIGAFRPVLTPR